MPAKDERLDGRMKLPRFVHISLFFDRRQVLVFEKGLSTQKARINKVHLRPKIQSTVLKRCAGEDKFGS